LDEPAEEFAVQIKNLGAKCCVNSVAEADMFLIKGKAGLLACSLWSIAGATLVNDQPIPVMYAESILSLANRHEGIYPIGKGAHAALIANQTSIGPALLKLPQDHTLAELVQAISRGDGSGRSAPAKKKGWWPF
jgi:hypothetical protein